MTEEWRKIPEYENYEVSSLGNVRRGVRVLKPILYTNNYYCIQLPNRVNKTIHRLVALVFIPNPDNKPYVDHISGNKLDNRLENLRWVTQSENRLNPNTPQKTGISKLTNIYMRENAWVVSIQRNSIVAYYQRFKTKEEAITARDNFVVNG